MYFCERFFFVHQQMRQMETTRRAGKSSHFKNVNIAISPKQ